MSLKVENMRTSNVDQQTKQALTARGRKVVAGISEQPNPKDFITGDELAERMKVRISAMFAKGK